MFCRVSSLLCAFFSVVVAQTYRANPLYIETCPVAKGKQMDIDVGIKGEGEEKALSMRVVFPVDFNDKYTFEANIDMLNNGQYIHYMEYDGAVCDTLTKSLKIPFDKLKMGAVPRVDEECHVSPGEYTLSDYKIREDELDVLIPATGQFKVTTRIYNPDGEEVACLRGEGIITEGSK